MVSGEIKFWKEYMKLDSLKRGKHIEFIVNNLYRLATTKGISEEHRKMMLGQILNSYFDDLLNTVEFECDDFKITNFKYGGTRNRFETKEDVDEVKKLGGF